MSGDDWTPSNRRPQPRRKPKEADLAPIIDAGREYYKIDPEALLISIARRAAAQYASKDDQLAFLIGYQQARLQHDIYLLEQAQDTAPTEDTPTDPA